jgi:hypothetical protein
MADDIEGLTDFNYTARGRGDDKLQRWLMSPSPLARSPQITAVWVRRRRGGDGQRKTYQRNAPGVGSTEGAKSDGQAAAIGLLHL